jgi:hypothetical protein
MVPVGFFGFMPSMGVALLRRRSRVKGVLRYRRKGRDVLRGDLASPSWRLGGWFRRTYIGNRVQPVVSGHALEVTDSEYVGYIDQSTWAAGLPAMCEWSSRSSTPPGNRYPGDRGTEIIATPTRTPWNSFNARLTALCQLGRRRPVVTNRTGPKWRGMVRGMK